MDWTLEDNMGDGLGRRVGHTPFVQTGVETPDSGTEAVKTGTKLFFGGSLPLGGCPCRGCKYGVLWGCPLTPHSIGDPPSAPHVYCCCQVN